MVDLDPPLPSSVPDQEGSGALEAVAVIAGGFRGNGMGIAKNGDFATWFLGELWLAGYKVVPLEPEDVTG